MCFGYIKVYATFIHIAFRKGMFYNNIHANYLKLPPPINKILASFPKK